MDYNGNEGGPIDLETAARWTANFRAAHDNDPNLVKAHYFGEERIRQILEQTGNVGIRMYYALDGDGKRQLILVGVDSEGNNMENGLLLDHSLACPPNCGTARSVLNE